MANVTETAKDAAKEVLNRPERTEGGIAKAIEKQTSKMPSDWFLAAALASIGVSLALQVAGKKEKSLFFGEWVPTILLFGVYNKIVKVSGSDRFDRGTESGFGSRGGLEARSGI